MEHLHCIGRITCAHAYADDTKGLELIPTLETILTCQQEGLWLLQQQETVEIYTDINNPFIINAQTLLFWIRVTDVQFYNYIELDETLQNQEFLYYFTNTEEKQILEASKATLKNIQRKTQVILFDEVVTEADQIKVYNHVGDLVRELTVDAGAKSTLLDITDEDDGLYTWTFNANSGSIYVTDKDVQHIIGVYQFELVTASEHHITLQFETKKTYWEYLIIPKEETEEHLYDIIDTKGEISFSYLGKKAIANIEAICYLSDQKIPYRKYTDTLFKLVANSQNTHPYLTLEDRVLPNGSPENIRIHHTADGIDFKTQTILYI
ncbi:MAG: hypothetical protein AAF617_01575 [Bacteroidota bacterium]